MAEPDFGQIEKIRLGPQTPPQEIAAGIGLFRGMLGIVAPATKIADSHMQKILIT
jgi:hypothetical protein